MLDGEKQGSPIGREFAAANFGAHRGADDLSQIAALGPAGGDHIAPVVPDQACVGIRHHPQSSGRVEPQIVGASDRADFGSISEAGVIKIFARKRTGSDGIRIGEKLRLGIARIASEQEEVPSETRASRV